MKKKKKTLSTMKKNIADRGNARLNFILPQEINDLFQQVHRNTGGYKYMTLKACLMAFDKLPLTFQLMLKSGNEELTKECLEKIEKLK